MKFYDREKEIEELKKLENNGSRMIVIYGRRRIGKTTLIKKLIDSTKAKNIYFFVSKNTKINELMSDYREIIKEKLQLEEYEKIENSEQLIKLLFDKSKNEKIITIFDEFQNFQYIDPKTIDSIQKQWDLMHDQTNLSLIFSGSSVGMIKKIFTETNSPLFKRAFNMIELTEFKAQTIFNILEDIGVKNFEEKLKTYFMFGGIIYYYSLMKEYNVSTTDEAIEKLILSPHAPLKNAVKEDMIETFGKESQTYTSILQAIANGKNTNNEIAMQAEIKETSLTPYVNDLTQLLSAISTQSIITEKPKKHSKKNKYYIKDNFYNFWFKFIEKNADYYEIGDFETIQNKIKKDIESFNGLMFERFAKEFLLLLNNEKKLAFKIKKIGGWWGKNPNKPKGMEREEIDLIATNDETNNIAFIECKWKNKQTDSTILNELKRKANLVQWNNTKRKEHYIIISKSNFTQELKEKAAKEKIALFNLKQIEETFKQ